MGWGSVLESKPSLSAWRAEPSKCRALLRGYPRPELGVAVSGGTRLVVNSAYRNNCKVGIGKLESSLQLPGRQSTVTDVWEAVRARHQASLFEVIIKW